jgi:hypothetical protein
LEIISKRAMLVNLSRSLKVPIYFRAGCFCTEFA